MPEGQEDDKPIPVGVAGLASRSQQLLDFPLGQIFPDPVFGILSPPGNCRLFRYWGFERVQRFPCRFSSGFDW